MNDDLLRAPAPTLRAQVINSKLDQIAESANKDPELITLAATTACFEQLDSAERTRAVDYLRSRYGKPDLY